MIFVSHKQEDEASYIQFCHSLDGAGIGRWDKETMAIGRPLPDQLVAAISKCNACVFLATKRSVESKWCMAELGAFWGSSKQVIIFVADPDVDIQNLPVQFQGNLWTKDVRKVLETLQNLSSNVLEGVLTPDLVLLLRYLERDNQWVLPDRYGRYLAKVRSDSDVISETELRGWERAVRYGLLYLSTHGLVDKQADTSVTYFISEFGKEILNLASVQGRFKESFDLKL
ncbi:MAG: toll/interleukin-1 receptor domain-containing protein [Halopseudomonas sp.]